MRRAPLFVLVVLFLVAAATPATGVARGRNGEIAVHRAGDIYAVHPNGTGLRDLSNMKRWGYCGSEVIQAREVEPAWSPDGTALVMTVRPVPDSCGFSFIYSSVWLVFPGFPPTPLTDPEGDEERSPTWSPDGSKIALLADNKLAVMRPTGQGKVSLGVYAWDPVWSPDSDSLLYRCSCPEDELRIVPATGGTPVPVVTGAPFGHDWSPDGTTIVYSDGDDVFSIPASGGTPVNLTAGVDLSLVYPRFSPDGHRLVVQTYDTISGDMGYATMPSDGSAGLTPLLDGSLFDSPASWQALCTVRGNRRDNTLRGTPGPDFFCGLGGDDTIIGNGGDDRILGGPGNDRIDGGGGNDVLVGGPGDDRSLGRVGNDLLMDVDRSIDDVLAGGGGVDSCWAQNKDAVTGCE